MPNAFSREERVAFEDLIESFNDALILSRAVSKYRTEDVMMSRTGDTIWRPMPYISQSFDGMDATSNFKDITQLVVPAKLGFSKHSAWSLDAKELRDALRDKQFAVAAKQRLASDINIAVMDVAANEGTVVIKRTAAASGFDDVAQADSAFNEIGVQSDARYLALSSRDYNNMAKDLANRSNLTDMSKEAYKRAAVGIISGFETYKLDYANRLAAAAGVSVTVNGANQYHTPKATSTASSGEVENVDNRYQNLAITVTSGTVAVGDAFTLAGVNSAHLITKKDTGQLKTFRVTKIISGGGGTGTVQISPAIISAGGGTDAEKMYQNVTAAPANGAAVTFLNTVAANVNPFWHQDAIELLPGRYAVPTDAGAAVMRATTEQGIEVTIQKFYDINTMKTKFRMDVFFGVAMKQPEMAGIMLFSQT